MAPIEQLPLEVLEIGQIAIRDNTATVPLTLVINPVSGEGSTTPLSSLYAERLVHCIKENGTWKVWRLGPTASEFAAMLASEASHAKRDEMLRTEPDLRTPFLVRTVIALGDRFIQQGNYQTARVTYSVAAEVAETVRDNRGKAAAERGIGNSFFYTRQNTAARLALKQSFRLAEEAGDKAEAARTLDALGNIYVPSRNFARALSCYRKSLNLIVGDDAERARVINNIGNVYFAEARFHVALRYYRTSLAIKMRSPDNAAVSIALYNVANALTREGHYAEALRDYEDSLERSEKAGRKAGLASIHRAMGDVYDSLHDDNQAAHNYAESLDFSRQLGDASAVFECLRKLGLIHYRRAEYTRALESDREALALAKRINDPSRIAQALDLNGLAEQGMGNLQGAIDDFAVSKTIRESLSVNSGRAWNLANLGAAYQVQKQYVRAAVLFDIALKQAQKDRDWIQLTRVLLLSSELHYERGDRDGSARLALRAAQFGRRFGLSEMFWQAETLGARTLLTSRQSAYARRTVDQAIAAYDDTEGEPSVRDYDLLQGGQITTSPYDLAIHDSLRTGDASGAWFYCERAAGARLRRILGERAVSIPATLTAEERSTEESLNDRVRATRATWWNSLTEARKAAPHFKVNLQRYRRARNRYISFEARLQSAHPGLSVNPSLRRSSKWKEARRILPGSNSAFLQFYVLPDSLAVFVLRTCAPVDVPSTECSGITVHQVKIPATELSRLVARFQKELEDPQGTYEESGHELYQLLIKPVARQIEGVRFLYVIPDGALCHVAFAAVLQDDGRPLLERFSISYLPSFAAYKGDGSGLGGSGISPATSARLIALAAPEISKATLETWDLFLRDRRSPLRSNQDAEVRELGDVFGAERSTILVGPDAPKKAFQLATGPYDVVHIAAPAFLDDRNPTHSVILFAPTDENDGVLEVQDFPLLAVRARVIVLADSQIVHGEDDSGLGSSIMVLHWALAGGGCRSLVLSRWPPDPAGARFFFSHFYQSLLHGESAASALRGAQLEMLEQSSFAHPSYWAAFMSMGCE